MTNKLLALSLSLLTIFSPLSAAVGTYVGQLQEKWQFPSDHLPIGMTYGDLHIASWNVLDSDYMDWVTEKNSQGLSRSLIANEHIYLDGSNLTLRDQHVANRILGMLTHPTHPRSIISLQECNDAFLAELHARLPSQFAIIAHDGNALVFDQTRFAVERVKAVAGIFADSPKRTFQEVALRRQDSGELLRLVNAHLPGDPQKPARFEFAKYLAETFDPSISTIAMGDMNFNEEEMADAFKNSAFSIYTPYCTNISPSTFYSKAIDHFIVYSSDQLALNLPEEVMQGLDETLELLTEPVGVEDSVTPLIEEAENLSVLSPRKYTHNQFEEIADVLSKKSERLRIVSYNLLRNDYEDRREEINQWPARLPRVVQALNEMQPDLIGVQEVSKEMLDELKKQIGETYGFFGQPRKNGEINGIFYRKERLKIYKRQVYIIRETHNTLTMVQFKDAQTGKKFAHFNIHMAFDGADDREMEARYIVEKMDSVAEKMPVLLTGDLNTFPARIDQTRFPFYDGDYIDHIFTKNLLRDAEDISLLGHVGPLSTFTNEPPGTTAFQGLGTPGVVLDRVYVSKKIEVLIHATQPIKVDGHFPSDHMPVLVDFLVK